MASRAPDSKKKLEMKLPRTVRIEDKTFFEGTISVDEVTAAAIRKELRRSRVVRPYVEDTIVTDEGEAEDETDADSEVKPGEHL